MHTEQRKYVRFISRDKAYAALGPSYIKVGRIRDIGIGGLSFTYICDDALSNGCISVNIMGAENDFILADVPCSLTYEISLYEPVPNYTYMTNLITKQCGIKFGSLSHFQLSKLQNLIESYTR